MSAPTKCQNCGFSSRYSRQTPGEALVYVAEFRAWLCKGCRDLRGLGEVDNTNSIDAKLREDIQACVPPNDGVYGRIPDTVYHADRGSLSSSGGRKLLAPSCPAIYWAEQQDPPNPKPQYDFGHAAHKMVLGEGAQLVKVDAENWRTGDAQKARNKAWAEGKAPLLKKDIDQAQRMAGRVFSHPIAGKLLDADGTAELSGWWHDDDTGVRLRFRPDWLLERPGSRMICVDYKTAVSASPDHFARSAADYGYHQQAAWYLDGLREVEVSDDAAFVFVVQSKTAPFLVSVVQLDAEAIQLGRDRNRAAIDIYAKCLADGQWPGYGDGIHSVSLPRWAVNQQQAALDAD